LVSFSAPLGADASEEGRHAVRKLLIPRVCLLNDKVRFDQPIVDYFAAGALGFNSGN
jgi:hypothetical protein